MAFLTERQISELGFKQVGIDVQISDKASIYNPGQITIGDRSRIDDFCVLSGNVIIGSNVHIAVFSNIAGGREGVVLEDFSGLAYGCHVFSQSDNYTGESLTNPTVPEKFKMETKSRVTISKHCIVGANSIVMPGVFMAVGCSLGAMSMLTKSTEEWGVYVGIPARRVRSRSKALLDMESAYLKEIGRENGDTV